MKKEVEKEKDGITGERKNKNWASEPKNYKASRPGDRCTIPQSSHETNRFHQFKKPRHYCIVKASFHSHRIISLFCFIFYFLAVHRPTPLPPPKIYS